MRPHKLRLVELRQLKLGIKFLSYNRTVLIINSLSYDDCIRLGKKQGKCADYSCTSYSLICENLPDNEVAAISFAKASFFLCLFIIIFIIVRLTCNRRNIQNLASAFRNSIQTFNLGVARHTGSY